jgi:hypothetical protein
MVFVAACTSCHNDPVETRLIASPTTIAFPELTSIDSLMWQRPDSALAVLLDYLNTDGRDAARHVSTDETFDNHYAHLLLAELLYKNDYAQTNRTELQQAVSYFDSLVRQAFPPFKGVPEGRGIHTNNSNDILSFLDARAHYINGVGYYENDSAVEACAEYLKALEIIEEHFGEKELVGKRAHFMALTYTRLTGLFSDQYLHEQAVYFGKCAMGYYNRYDATIGHLVWMFDEIGSNYDVMGNLDSAIVYYNKGIEMLTDTNNLAYRDLSVHIAFLTYQLTKEPSIVVKQLRSQLVLSESRKEYLSRSLTIGEIFFHERQFDSAYVYLSDVFYYSDNIDSKKQAAEWLVAICKAQCREEETHKYANFLVPFANQEENKSAVKSQLTEKYNTFRQNELEKKYIEEVRKNTKYILIVIGGLLVVLMTVIVLHLRRKKNLKTQLEAENHAHKMQQAALSGRLKRSNEELRELKDQIRQRNDAVAKTEAAASFTEEPVCRLILERVKEGRFKSKVDCTAYKDFALNKQQLLDLRLAADRHYDQFTVRLKKAYPELTQGDLDYCCLYLLGLTDADIAALMQRAYNTVIERNGKMRKIFGSENPLPITLKSITNGFSLA